ncbi:MAG: hypothetical protein ACMUIU_19085 [bacterium]
MIIGKIKEKILKKSNSHFLLPIEQAGPYYGYLVSRYCDRVNPFKRLTNETDSDLKKSCMSCSDSQIKLSMNQSHVYRYLRQNVTYFNVSRNISYINNLRKMKY